MQTLQFRDIILRLIHENVKDKHSYEWLREIRCYNNLN